MNKKYGYVSKNELFLFESKEDAVNNKHYQGMIFDYFIDEKGNIYTLIKPNPIIINFF